MAESARNPMGRPVAGGIHNGRDVITAGSGTYLSLLIAHLTCASAEGIKVAVLNDSSGASNCMGSSVGGEFSRSHDSGASSDCKDMTASEWD